MTQDSSPRDSVSCPRKRASSTPSPSALRSGKSTLSGVYWIPALPLPALAALGRGRVAGMTADRCAHGFFGSAHVIRQRSRTRPQALQIFGGGAEDARIVAREAEQKVARNAQQLAHFVRDVIMIEHQLTAAAPADGAGIVLARLHLAQLPERHHCAPGRVAAQDRKSVV